MSILSKNKLSLPSAIGLGTTVLGAAGNLFGLLLGRGSNGSDSKQQQHLTDVRVRNVLRDNLFTTLIQPPFFKTASEGALSLYSTAVNLPGASVGINKVRRYGFGPNVPYATDVDFNDVAVTFIADGSGVVLRAFNYWINDIVKFSSSGDPGEETNDYLSPSNKVQGAPYFFNYKKEYVAKKFLITLYNEVRDEIFVYSLEDAFPTSVSDINLNWGSTNQLASFTVNFTYTRWTQTMAKVGPGGILNKQRRPSQGDASILSTIFQAGTAATMLTSLKKPRSIGDIINTASTAAFILGRFEN